MMTVQEYFKRFENRIYTACENPPVRAEHKGVYWRLIENNESLSLTPDEFYRRYEVGYFLAPETKEVFRYRRKLTGEEISAQKVSVIGVMEKVSLLIDGMARIVPAKSALAMYPDGSVSVVSGEEERFMFQQVREKPSAVPAEAPPSAEAGPKEPRGKVIGVGRFPTWDR